MLAKKYRCCNCGEIFSAEDAGTYHEYVADFWGSPAYNEYVACPCCVSVDLERNSEEEPEDAEN